MSKSEDDAFNELTDEFADGIVLAFTQRPDELGVEYDIIGSEDPDQAIALAVRGLFSMVLDSLGFWDGDEEEVDEDEEEDYTPPVTFMEPEEPDEGPVNDANRLVADALVERMEQLKDAAQKIGLYAQDIQLAQAAQPDGTAKDFLLIGSFSIGKLAWADRVQDPDSDEMKTEFAKLEHDLTADALQDLRDRLLKSRESEDDTPNA